MKKIPREQNYCDYCGREVAECVCYLAADFPDEPIPELDTDVLDWDHYEEENSSESNRIENLGEAEDE